MRRRPDTLSSALGLLAGLYFVLGPSDPAWSQFTTQILTDGSLPGQNGATESVGGSAGIFEIGEQHGYRVGPTLFHSFQRFDVGTGDTALFSADPGFTTDNIVGRVTGGMRSRIDGTLSTGSLGANLYLLNPSGILFGPNASLDLTGAFHASTAESLGFVGGELFEASSGGAVPLLAAVEPTAFGFLGDSSARITVQSLSLAGAPEIALRAGAVELAAGEVLAHRVTLEGGEVLVDADSRVRSAGGSGSIAILGGDLFLRGRVDASQATAAGGEIEIRGDFVEISRVDPLIPNAEFRSVDSGGFGAPSGDIWIAGDTVVIRNAGVNTRSRGGPSSDAGDITVEAGSLEMDGVRFLLTGSATGDAGSVLVDVPNGSVVLRNSDIYASGYGAHLGGDIEFRAGAVWLDDDSVIQASTFGSGDAGNITFDVDSLRLTRRAFINSSAGLLATGSAGSITVLARDSVEVVGEGELGLNLQSLLLTGEGSATVIGAITGGAGDAGSVVIDAPLISVSNGGVVAAIGAGGLFGPGGDAGDITLRGDRIQVMDGGLVDSGSAFKGRGGTVSLLADEAVVVSGRSASGVPSRVRSFNAGSGPGGDILIQAPLVALSEGGAISASTANVRVLNFPAYGSSAGKVRIEADELTLESGGRIESSSFSDGPGGTIEIDASRRISLTGADTGIFGQAAGSGVGGEVTLSAPVIELRDGAAVSTSAQVGLGASAPLFEDLVQGGLTIVLSNPTGDAGSIGITAAKRIVLEDALVTSATETPGKGGSVHLTAPRIRLERNAAITTRSTGDGDAGRIEVDVRDLQLRSSRITAEALDSFGGSIAINGEAIAEAPDGTLTALVRPDQQQGDLVRLRDSAISTSVGVGQGDGGNVLINSKFVIFETEGAAVKATAAGGDGGNILLATDFAIAPSGDVVASLDASSQSGVAGVVEVTSAPTNVIAGVTPLDTRFQDASDLMQTLCAARQGGGTFHIARMGGLPSSPEDPSMAFADVPAGDGPGVRAAGLSEGEAQMASGRFGEASEHFRSAALAAARTGDALGQSDALRRLALAEQATGRYEPSMATLQQALALAEAADDSARAASALGGLANARLVLGEGELAQQLFVRASETARSAGRFDMASAIQNSFGTHLEAEGRRAEALAVYEEAAATARRADLPLPHAQALANASRAAAIEEPERSRRSLALAEEETRGLPASREKLHLEIQLAKTRASLAPAPGHADLLAAHALLTDGIELAERLDEPRARSYALGNLGALYEADGRTEEALQLTRRALRVAEQASAPDILYRWHWQQGRLLWARGEASRAIRSYRRAVAILQEIRPEARAQFGVSARQFRASFAPVYLDYVDSLLQSSSLVASPSDAQRLLIEARAAMELLKAAELRDYFRDECVAEIEARQSDIDRVSRESGAAVIYPILLPDRIELLVSLPSGVERYTVPAGAARVDAVVETFGRSLRKRVTREYREPARQLYDWLVAPYASRLAEQEIKTLVFVPDGALRTIPMAALHDGDRFLVERYALAVAPGLSLVDPKPLEAGAQHVLIAGLSGAVQGYPALPGTTREIQSIQELYHAVVLVDEEFRTQRFEAEVASENPSIVHVASHAFFSGDPDTSFVLTHDGHIDMERLSEVVVPTQFRERNLELLSLSACATAAGDERAALGLAGVAIRAGARSAIGSLWSVSDEATSELFLAFYEELKKPGVSKVEALRRGQRELLEDRRFAHPYYWSAFLLISNWL